MRSFFTPLLLICLVVGALTQNPSKPNIILILADDFGYSSVNSYGADKSLIRTPNIDRIAENGMKFTDASTPASICTPTRVGLLTGRYPWRTSLKFGVNNGKDPLLLDPNKATLADILKDQGYNTAAVGKWHLGYGSDKPDWTGKLSPGPLDLGFDYHFGVPQNHDDFLGVYIENDQVYGLRSDKVHQFSKSYYGRSYLGLDAPHRVNKDVMQDLTDRSVDWIKKQSNDKPFFLYFAAIAVHHPITPSDYMRGLSDAGPYGDFIQDLDWSVGQIMNTLDYMGLADNTMIIFTSDNGGEIPGGKAKEDAPENVAKRYGLKANGDLRGDKHTIWEGGTRVPFIVSWPGKIQEGSQNDDMVNLVDLYATFNEMMSGQGDLGDDFDSYSMLGHLLGKNDDTRESMVTADANGRHAIRVGDWKYIDDTQPPGLAKARPHAVKQFVTELYNLKEDPQETKNVIEQNPKKAKELKKLLDGIRGDDFP